MSHERWHAIWSQRGLLAWILWPISLVYATLAGWRRRLYGWGVLKVEHLPVPVIVVGNVVVGGAGKTPTVIALIDHLKAEGWRPGVISRGYGREGDDVLAVLDDTPPPASGDEPALIRRRTGVPVFVARHRVDAARALLARHPDTDLLLCDDGLQHLALGRDMTVVVFDERGVGNGWLLPAGLLREPWPPAGGHHFPPDLVLCQRRELAAAPVLPGVHLPIFEALRQLADHAIGPKGEGRSLNDLRRQPLIAVAGIARPQPFFDMLHQRGLNLARCIPMADHAPTSAYEALDLQPGDTVICTEKDAVKLFAVLPAGVSAWAVPLELVPEPAFWTAFDALLAQRIQRH